jgi:hypothetical protein
VTHELSLVPLSTKLTVGLLSHFNLPWVGIKSGFGPVANINSIHAYFIFYYVIWVWDVALSFGGRVPPIGETERVEGFFGFQAKAQNVWGAERRQKWGGIISMMPQ